MNLSGVDKQASRKAGLFFLPASNPLLSRNYRAKSRKIKQQLHAKSSNSGPIKQSGTASES
jgi:hypothetical protein